MSILFDLLTKNWVYCVHSGEQERVAQLVEQLTFNQ